MCCRYYVEPTPYFVELGELAQKTTNNSRLKINEGQVMFAGEISPGNVVPVLASNKAGKKIAFLMFWGMHAKDGKLVINARSETAAEKQMFSESWAEHRCIIPASWYYEWAHRNLPDGNTFDGFSYSKRQGKPYSKQPGGSSLTARSYSPLSGGAGAGQKYYLQPAGSDKTFLCGIYRMENKFPYFAVLTRDSSPDIAFIHDRMPLIMPEDLADDWIDPKKDPKELAKHALTEMVFEKVIKDDPQLRLNFDEKGNRSFSA